VALAQAAKSAEAAPVKTAARATTLNKTAKTRKDIRETEANIFMFFSFHLIPETNSNSLESASRA
jgi:hypothetical protein